MRWHEVTVHTTEEAVEMVSNFMHELGAGGVAIEESGTLNKPRDTSLGQWYELPLNDIPEGRAIIKGYYSEGTDIDQLLRQLRQSIRQLAEFDIDTGSPVIEHEIVNEEDWANGWKQYYKPVRISDRLTVKPTWEDYTPAPEEIVLEMDPGMAFGTGTHATTSLCLKTLDKIIRGGEDVIDVGTGSGVLSIAAAKLGAKAVLALDLDPVAVSSARENIKLNGLEQHITVKQSDLLGAIKEKDADQREMSVSLPVQVVVANILAEIIVQFVEDVPEALQPGGLYLVSGIIEAKRDMVEQALKEHGFAIEDVYSEQDWIAIVARKL